MELRHLRYFVAVAEERHFTRAAKRLRIAQPALSRQIRDLEAELGCALFDRQARAITLTAAGEALLLEARKVIVETEGLKEATKRASNGQAGRISIGYVSWIVPKFLFPLVRATRQNYPSLEIDVKEMTPFDQIQALSNDRLHLGFAKFLLTHPPEGIQGQPVSQHELSAILPEGHPKIRPNRAVPLKTLANEAFIFVDATESAGYAHWIQNECVKSGFAPKVVRIVDRPEAALNQVRAGTGIALLPLPEDRPMDWPGLVVQRLAPPVPTFTQNVYYRTDHPTRYPAVARLLKEILKASQLSTKNSAAENHRVMP